MKTLLLRYSDTPLTSLTYDTAETWTSAFCTLNPVWISPATPSVERENGRLLNGRGYSHVLYSYKKIDITIASDDAGSADGSSAVFTYLQTFFKSAHRYISFGSLSAGVQTYSDYAEVISDGGDFPVEYLDGLIDLPEITFNFEYAEAE